jgi:hypothetical protein
MAIGVLSVLDDDDRAMVGQIVGTAQPEAAEFLMDALAEVDLRKSGTFPPVEPEQSSAIELATLSEQVSRLAIA